MKSLEKSCLEDGKMKSDQWGMVEIEMEVVTNGALNATVTSDGDEDMRKSMESIDRRRNRGKIAVITGIGIFVCVIGAVIWIKKKNS